MKFSVVIPVYNKQAYIGRAIESVLTQDISDFQLVVVDDGSTDGSIDVVRSFRDDRIVLVSKPNGGEGSARNAGIREAVGDFICFLDADDTWEPWFLSEVMALADENDNVALIATAFLIKERDGNLVRYLDGQIDRFVDHEGRLDYLGALSEGLYPVSSSSVCVRARVLSSAGMFDEALRIGADIDMWIRASATGLVKYSRRYSATYRRDAENRSVDQVNLLHKRHEFVAKLVSLLSGNLRDIANRSSLEKVIAKKGYEIFCAANDRGLRGKVKNLVGPFSRHLLWRQRLRIALSGVV